MKVYVTEEQELIMEPCLKWAANPNVTVAVKAYGLKATIQVQTVLSSARFCSSELTEICVSPEIFRLWIYKSLLYLVLL